MYQALYRKYRPQTFDDVVGQESITQTLKTQLMTDRLSHAYLFTGSRGTGKTTCSKILAKAVNCLHPVDGNPCNRCAACRSIDDGSCLDVLEIDAASNNGVDNVRSLRDDAIYAPSEVKKRVYIIDEVHMLSMSAFNALLKIIEEPPAHLLFILATTELHKVPATILSRCQRFAFRRITPEDVAARISYVAYEEGIDLAPEAASLLGRLADGALRDGLSLLDQCAASVTDTLTAEKVYACLGLVGARKAAELMGAVADHKTHAALELLAAQYAEGKDIAALLDELVCLCRDLLVMKTAPESGRAMLSGVCTDTELRSLLPRLSAGELLRMTHLLQDTASGFNKSANRRVDAELCLMQMCDPTLSLDAESINARLSRLEQTVASGRITLVQATDEVLPPQTPSETQREESPAETEKTETVSQSDELPMGFWPDLVAAAKQSLPFSVGGYFTTSDRSMLTPVLHGDLLDLEAASDFTKNLVDSEKNREILAQKASAILDRPIRVRFTVRDDALHGPDKLKDLTAFGREHPDVFHIKEE